MCRLLGIVKKRDDVPRDILYDFISLAREGRVPTPRSERGHRDGWGIAVFMNDRPVYVGRSARSVLEDPSVDTAVDIVSRTRSPVVVGHMRKSSGTQASLSNTHPFSRNGWVFCHNGTVFNHRLLPLKKYDPEGDTDSERIFLFVLEKIGRNTKNPGPAILAAIDDIRTACDFSSLTFLMSNGRHLFSYREYNPQCRRGGYRSAQELRVYYTLFHTHFPWGTVICSEPLGTSRMWRLFHNREFRIYPLSH